MGRIKEFFKRLAEKLKDALGVDIEGEGREELSDKQREEFGLNDNTAAMEQAYAGKTLLNGEYRYTINHKRALEDLKVKEEEEERQVGTKPEADRSKEIIDG